MVLFFHILLPIFGCAAGFDPFEGTQPIFNCLTCRTNAGCNKTLLEAYKETEVSKTDNNMNDADTKVYLFTRFNRKQPECLHLCGGSVPRDTLYDQNKPTIIFIGGHLSTFCTFTYFSEFKTQLLCRGDYNVIIVDWPWGNGPDISVSMRNIRIVGQQVAFVIQNILTATATTTCEKIHIIGHGYAAHIAGYVGTFVKRFKQFRCTIGRITGMEPIGVAFDLADPKDRLDPSDAKHVDVMHCNAGTCFPFSAGSHLLLGHADFFLNGGSVQLSCIPYIIEAFLKGDYVIGMASLYFPLCNHFQCIRYFLASINPGTCQFVGVECKSYEDFQSGRCRSCGEDGSKCAVMGMDHVNYPHQKGSHTYYLDTTLLCPYCKNGDVNLEGFPYRPGGNASELHRSESCDV